MRVVKPLWAATSMIAMFAPVATAVSTADRLSVHEREGIMTMFYSRMGCVDIPRGHCVYGPTRIVFASDYGTRASASAAYAAVTYKSFDNRNRLTGKRGAMLFGSSTTADGR